MKENIAILFGGQSPEHEVSLKSVTTIINNINKDKYNIYLLGISKEGQWLLYDGDVEGIVGNKWLKEGQPAIISPDASHRGIIVLGDPSEIIKIDKVFPVLHGENGEDGTVQGLFEMAQIPYVGCGVLSSSVSMDKSMTKIVADANNIPQASYVLVRDIDIKDAKDMDKTIKKVEKEIPYPCFIKPANTGSSVGISKAHNRDDLIKGLKLAADHDKKILVEETIVGREVETAALGNSQDIRISGVGEIKAAAEFYDYDAKYNNEESETIINADLEDEIKEEIRTYAKKIFQGLEGKGLARIDFFVREDNKVIFNEINTLPGFTSISMYPMLWKDQGIELPDLIDKLLSLASLQ